MHTEGKGVASEGKHSNFSIRNTHPSLPSREGVLFIGFASFVANF
jgi:hypothetical protein